MVGQNFMTVEEVAQELRVSKSKAYEIVRNLNKELQEKGYLTVAGRINTTFFHKKQGVPIFILCVSHVILIESELSKRSFRTWLMKLFTRK